MKYFYVLSLFVLYFYPNHFAQAQLKDSGTDYNLLYKSVVNAYGFDQVLVNGIYYKNKYRNMPGHQYFLDDQLYEGTLIYKDKEYANIEMKFDIYDHQLILYMHNNNSVVWIVPPADFISSFKFDNRVFSKYEILGESRFFQVVFETKKLTCLYYWYKEIQDSFNSENSGSVDFTESKKKNYLMIEDSFNRYKNNRSFTMLFPKDIKDKIRQYIKNNHIEVDKSSDEKIIELLEYCNVLL